MKLVLVLLALAAACGSPSPPPPADSIQSACGPWRLVGPDETIGPRGLSVREAFAAIAGSHRLDGASVTGASDLHGTLTVEIGELGPTRLSSPQAPGAPLGSCGVSMDLLGHATSDDGAIHARFDGATLWLAGGGEAMTAALAADLGDGLPEPYQAIDPLTLVVGMRFGRATPVAVTAELQLSLNHDQVWVWSAAP